jgi:hypothetical protein
MQRATSWHFWALCFYLALFSATVFGAVITPVPATFILDGNVREWNGIPPVTRLWSSAVTVKYAIWFGQSRDGLVVAGLVRNSGLKFAKDSSELENKDRVEVWLSVADQFDLPKVKYDEEACTRGAQEGVEKGAACLEWLKEQNGFRERLTSLFTRMWRITPYVNQESYALPAYDALSELQRNALRFSRPSGAPLQKFQTGADGTLTFEILIPWAIFPPANRLSLESVHLRVDLTDGGWVHVSTNPEVRMTGEGSLPSLAVAPPITTRITPCGQPLLGKNLQGDDLPAFYFLNRRLEIDKAFFFENPEYPYRPFLPEKDEISPVARHERFFVQELEKGEVLCGPFMSYRKGSVVRLFPFRLQPPGDQVSMAPLTSFPLKRLADGTRLIQYGPDRSYGPLWTRAYEVYSMHVFALTPSLQVQEALSLSAWSDGVPGYEIEISDDWRTVQEFRQGISGPWISETYCLTGHVYRSCAKDSNSPPPRKRVLTHDQ